MITRGPSRRTRAARVAPLVAFLASVASVASVAVADAAAGQAVRGVLMDAATGAPVPGAMVWLLADGGEQLPARLSGADGRFVLGAPAPGRYRVEAERIGYERATSDAFALSAGQTLERRLEIEVRAVALEGVTAEAGRRCAMLPEAGAAAARLWDEARKALSATAWAAEREVFLFELVRWRRELAPRSLRVLAEHHREVRPGASANPIRSLPAEQLARDGYIRPLGDGGHEYVAPDAVALLSDAFLDGHCFRVVDGEGDEARLVGLAFEPIPGRTLPDVEGTLWLDRETAELRFLELGYTRYPYAVSTDDLGARIEFEGLPNGAWIVRRWWIRMPRVEAESGWRPGRASGLRLRSVVEDGGEVRGIRLRDAVVAERPRAVLEGVVADSTRLEAAGGGRPSPRPLANALVYLSGTAFSATTDPLGEFRIEGLPEGTYQVSFEHPRLDSLALYAEPLEVRLEAGEASWAALTVPSRVSQVEGFCPDRNLGTGMLVGQVTDDERRPVPGAALELAWSTFEGRLGDPRDLREVVTALDVPLDRRGTFRVCGVDGLVRLRVSVSGRPVLADTIRVHADALAERVLRVRWAGP